MFDKIGAGPGTKLPLDTSILNGSFPDICHSNLFDQLLHPADTVEKLDKFCGLFFCK
jgi:hypothetical protein